MSEDKVCVGEKVTEEEKNSADDDSSTIVSSNPEAVDKLSEGLVTLYQPHMERIRKQLLELTKKQERLVDQLEGENTEFQGILNRSDLHEMMAVTKGCLAKLTVIKKEMANIHERTGRLKKRALRLQQAKQREALERTHEREERLLQEQRLIADPAWVTSTRSSPGTSCSRSSSKESPLVSPSEAAEEDKSKGSLGQPSSPQ